MLDSCYYIPRSRGDDHLYSWWDARYLCKQVLGPDADLVAIHNQEQMDALTHMLRNHFGGRNTAVECDVSCNVMSCDCLDYDIVGGVI